jgi:DNA polymerase-4
MAYPINLPFNEKPSTVMHIDLNSCFATIEQQANPLLRGRPIAVAAYDTPSGCILAPSVEAKKVGVKVGMRVKEGKLLCPELVVLKPDPWKYRTVHLQLRNILVQYTNSLVPKSIDEFVLNLEGYPSFSRGMFSVGQEIKFRIKQEIGDWITVSIGIGPNRFLAKMASNLKKPDGLEEINSKNYSDIYKNLSLPQLHGIDKNYTARLNLAEIYTVLDFYNASQEQLRSAFQSIQWFYWYLRLRGWEIDDVEFGRKSFGNMFSLPKPLVTVEELSPILHKLIQKMSYRMRLDGYKTRGLHLALLYRDHSFWHKGVSVPTDLFDPQDIYRLAQKILFIAPYRKPVANLAVSCFNLVKHDTLQLDLFNNVLKQQRLVSAIDSINERWGNFVITPAKMIGTQDLVPDRIAFGNIKELENFIIHEN